MWKLEIKDCKEDNAIAARVVMEVQVTPVLDYIELNFTIDSFRKYRNIGDSFEISADSTGDK